MEEFYLEKPSIKRKKEIVEYCEELVKYNSDINGIEVRYTSWSNFSRNIRLLFKIRNGRICKKIKKSPSKNLFTCKKKW